MISRGESWNNCRLKIAQIPAFQMVISCLGKSCGAATPGVQQAASQECCAGRRGSCQARKAHVSSWVGDSRAPRSTVTPVGCMGGPHDGPKPQQDCCMLCSSISHLGSGSMGSWLLWFLPLPASACGHHYSHHGNPHQLCLRNGFPLSSAVPTFPVGSISFHRQFVSSQ